MKTVETFNIKIEHKEPNNVYPNSKEAYVVSVPERGYQESFSVKTSASRKELELELDFFLNRAKNAILGIPNKELEL